MTGRPVAVVTAAAGAGIGSAVVRRLADDGFDVAITDKHAKRSEAFASELSRSFDRNFRAWELDVADSENAAHVFAAIRDHFGRIDVLVNNAGYSVSAPVVEFTVEDWRRCIEIDLNGTFYCMRAVLPGMIEQCSGSIVNLSSTAAWEAIPDHGAAYSAAKAGILALTRVAASEVGRNGIRVNAVAPGLIYNEFLRRIYPDEFFEGFADRRTFLGRLGTPTDVANVVSFLASDQASYVTGEVYGVSGGTAPHA